jgi:hypothetical protein
MTAASKALARGTADGARVAAAEAMMADVVTQASRLRLTVVPKTPTASDLG